MVVLFLFFVVLVFYGVLSGFGKMLFGAPEGTVVDHGGASSRFLIGNVLGNAVMIVMAVSVVALGFRVPAFIDATIKACVMVLGVK